MNIGIIGVGYWGSNITRVLFELKKEGLFEGSVFLYDINEKRSKEVGSKYSFKYVKSLKKILQDQNIDVILVVTPSSTHYLLAKQCLESGKHVFVEKPFTLDSKQAKKLIQLAKKKKKKIMVGHLFRYHKALHELKRRIKIGDLGKLLFMVAKRYGLGVPKEDAGVIFTLAVNEFDIFCYLLDVEYPETILAHRGTFLQENIEEFSSISVTFPNNIQGYFSESWLIPVFGRKRELIVVGSKKTAMIDFLKPNEFVIYDAHIKKVEEDDTMVFKMEKNDPQRIFFEYSEPLKEEMKALLKMVKEEKDSEASGSIGLRAIEMCEIAIESSNTGQKMDVIKWLESHS